MPLNKAQIDKKAKICSLNLLDPQFAGAAVMPYHEKIKEEIYFFFSEVNTSASLDEEPYRARIGRVCMVTTFFFYDSRFIKGARRSQGL